MDSIVATRLRLGIKLTTLNSGTPYGSKSRFSLFRAPYTRRRSSHLRRDRRALPEAASGDGGKMCSIVNQPRETLFPDKTPRRGVPLCRTVDRVLERSGGARSIL